MKLTFLGTACMVPTKERNTAGYFLEYKDQGILFDCGEGTQRQMNTAGIKRTKVSKVLLSHWHGDHMIGLLGLFQTIGDRENPPTVHLYGPKGSQLRIDYLFQSCIFEQKINIVVHELTPTDIETFFENKDFILQSAPMNHTTACLGFAFIEKDTRVIPKEKLEEFEIRPGPHLKKIKQGKSIEYKGKKITPQMISKIKKGKKIVYITDTRPTKTCIELAKNADILFMESPYTSDLADKAREFKHCTSKEAAEVAKKAKVKKLFLTHFSQRYKTTNPILEDAKAIFKKVECAKDLLSISL